MDTVRTRSAPIIMTAVMGDEDFAWANALRRSHFPPERNMLDAHVTMFHHLPPMQQDEIVRRVKAVVANYRQPEAQLSEVMQLGKGVAFRIESPELSAIRAELADGFFGMLTPQDQNEPRLHITVQNKVEPAVAKALYRKLSATFEPRPLTITGLALQYYCGGPWQEIGLWRFRGKERA